MAPTNWFHQNNNSNIPQQQANAVPMRPTGMHHYYPRVHTPTNITRNGPFGTQMAYPNTVMHRPPPCVPRSVAARLLPPGSRHYPQQRMSLVAAGTEAAAAAANNQTVRENNGSSRNGKYVVRGPHHGPSPPRHAFSSLPMRQQRRMMIPLSNEVGKRQQLPPFQLPRVSLPESMHSDHQQPPILMHPSNPAHNHNTVPSSLLLQYRDHHHHRHQFSTREMRREVVRVVSPAGTPPDATHNGNDDSSRSPSSLENQHDSMSRSSPSESKSFETENRNCSYDQIASTVIPDNDNTDDKTKNSCPAVIKSDHHPSQKPAMTQDVKQMDAASILLELMGRNQTNEKATQNKPTEKAAAENCVDANKSPTQKAIALVKTEVDVVPFVPPSFPTRLALPEDGMKLNSLHCFLREELLEVFVVGSSASSSTSSIKNKHSHYPGSSVGRVGLRCVFCARERTRKGKGKEGAASSDKENSYYDNDEAPMAVFYPKSIAEIYRLVTSWQRCHLRKCKYLPPDIRLKWKRLRENAKSRGKTNYWITSANRIGLVDDTQSRTGGMRFAKERTKAAVAAAAKATITTTSSTEQGVSECTGKKANITIAAV